MRVYSTTTTTSCDDGLMPRYCDVMIDVTKMTMLVVGGCVGGLCPLSDYDGY